MIDTQNKSAGFATGTAMKLNIREPVTNYRAGENGRPYLISRLVPLTGRILQVIH
ncbi:hypothetical protein [Paenibacillus andongensis]|uniref:hypothetical protein n=1 Tax=Paenibacillus andongensis TaxID=2975482 RepID=UPI0021BBA99E|nr:hypothetical protein [Paenibacillus andongensis]